MSCQLVIDTRERGVTVHADILDPVKYITRQICVGDYLVLDADNRIIVAMERKTLPDYAASFKDGRHENKEKLLKLRAETGCRLFYIIEGAPFPDPAKRFSGIPYANIESSIFHLMVRDGIMCVRTKDTLGTAKMLLRLLASIESMVRTYGGLEQQTAITAPTTPQLGLDDLPKIAVRTDDAIAREMWRKFKGVSSETASALMNQMSFGDVIHDRITITQLSEIRMSNGRRIGKKVISSIVQFDKTTQARVLSAIPGISLAGAVRIIEWCLARVNEPRRTLSAILECGDAAQDIKTSATKKLGKKLAGDIVKYLNFRVSEPAVAAVTAD